MIAVCQALPMTAEVRKAAKNKLVKKGMNLRFFNNSLMRSVKGYNYRQYINSTAFVPVAIFK